VNRPTYIDIAEFERASRASVEATFAIADEAVASGEADATFIAAQREFTEARIECALACARADNAGHPQKAVLAAAAVSLGQMIGSVLISLDNEDREYVLDWIEESMTAVVNGKSDREGTPVARVSSHSIVGGNA
jgi:hypothetical protein